MKNMVVLRKPQHTHNTGDAKMRNPAYHVKDGGAEIFIFDDQSLTDPEMIKSHWENNVMKAAWGLWDSLSDEEKEELNNAG